MTLREPTPADVERVREVVRSAMTTSFALSPDQIEAIVEDQFGEERLARVFESSESVVLLAEDGGGAERTVVGIVEGELADDRGEVRWLFVDPEHRGNGIGTRLFEAAVETLRDRGAERIVASTLEPNMEGHQFFERFGFEKVDDRRVEIGDESIVEYAYADPSAETETRTAAEPEKADPATVDLPGTETHDGVTTASTEDGRRVYINRAEEESGEEGFFFVAYVDEEYTERYGYYCSNCGSLDTTADNMGRIECGECGNTHTSRSAESYDESYL